MLNIVCRTVHTITDSEKKQFREILEFYFNTAEEEFFNDRISNDHNYDIVLLKKANEVVAASLYNVSTIYSPFHKKEVSVIQFGQAVKKRSYKGNAIAKLGIWYFRKKIGNLFLLKNCIAVSTVANPRVYEKLRKQFRIAHKKEQNDELYDFLVNYFTKHRKLPLAIDENFCCKLPHVNKIDITDNWEKSFKTKNKKINQLFIDNDIIRFENDKIYYTGKALIACGYRKPLKIKSTAYKTKKNN